MLKEVIALCIKELERLRIIHKVISKEIRQVDGARLLSLSDRQVRNMLTNTNQALVLKIWA